ncbi:hypothetical protein [Bacteroides salyersiae]|uniref:hypothetical protein n=1 Tax=Bacteroides salyersiae TaxID=291644 RepID=UPI001C8BBA91|nr:hypothetical protein [Bacteroides salyersiae]
MEASPKGRFYPSGYIIHIGFTPFIGFTFFNQTPYPSVIQGEGTPCFSGYRAHCPYARCLRPVCSVLTACMLGTWETFAQKPENGNDLSPCIVDEQSSGVKR